jgi:hypothetical protein
MVPLNSQNLARLNEMFSHPASVEVDSPLLREDRVDETQESLSKFGIIRLFLSPTSQEPLMEKIYNWSNDYLPTTAYFFKPEWQRTADPYQGASYRLYLRGWKMHKGQIELSASNKEALMNTLQKLSAMDLFVSFGGS